MAEPIKTSFSAGIIQQAASGLGQLIQGITSGTYMTPGQPMNPIGPPDLQTRIFDYPFGINLNNTSRTTESGISFLQLRGLADAYDILRAVIETRKDQVVKIPWSFRLQRQPGEKFKEVQARSQNDPRLKQLTEIFRYPDEERDWPTWIRAMLEDVFVLDALSIAPRYMGDGKPYAFDIIDGATIVRKIDAQGRTPGPIYNARKSIQEPESVAYQQILKGTPAKDLTTKDLVYKPRNYRSFRIYGFGPVEQIVLTVNMALRRQVTQLSFFTEGNVPEALAQVPDTWTAETIASFQAMFDALSGNLAKRSRIRFMPNLEKIVFPKEKMLADEFDEWLARIVCFCFSIPPTPFVRQVNRATAQTANETALSEGLQPILNFVKSVIEYLVERYFGHEGIEFQFEGSKSSDPKAQAEVDQIYVQIGALSGDEVREDSLGKDPVGLGHMIITASGAIPIDKIDEMAQTQIDSGKNQSASGSQVATSSEKK